MALGNDYADIAQMMQNFFNAVHNRTDARVDEAVYRLEALHGQTAALEAMVAACDAMREGEHEVSRFWMTVYAQLVAPGAGVGAFVTLH